MSLQEIKKIVPYCIISIVFHVVYIFTGFGNYLHGGSFLEFIILLAIATLILWQALKLAGIIKGFFRILLICLAIIPAISIAANLYLFIARS